jgi:hypothetical protein
MTNLKIISGAVVDFEADWASFKEWINGVNAYLPYTWADEGPSYSVIAIDNNIYRTVGLNKDGGANVVDFETNWKPFGSEPITQGNFTDPRIIHKFGNLTTTATSEVLVSTRPYVEQSSQAQRSVKSTSANDANPAGTGATEVRITYLDSNYVLKTEDVLLNGLTAVATVATDIRFIESFKVIKGAPAAGAIELWTNNNGTGTAICGIPALAEDAFLCHHYVPAGKRAYILLWGSTVSDDGSMKLKSQVRYGANLVDVNLDLDNLTGIAAGSRSSFERKFTGGMYVGEKTYIRITVVPGQATSTIIRAILDIWEDKA